MYADDEAQERWPITGMAEQEVVEATLPNAGISSPHLNFLTILSCQQTNTILTCDIQLDADKTPQQLILTDQAWLPAGDQIPATQILNITAPISNSVTVQLAGVVSLGGTPIIAYQEGTSTNLVGAVIPTHLIGETP